MPGSYAPRRGMALTELLAAMVILCLAVLGAYHYVNQRAALAKRTASIERMQLIGEALARFSLDTGGNLPTQRQGLGALIQQPVLSPVPHAWRGPYVSSPAILQDGWGRPFQYFCAGGLIEVGSAIRRPYDLASYGRDGVEGGKGLDRDILSWDRTTMIP
jgi:general secretion pathway protein G